MICPKCNLVFKDENSKFCRYCGGDLVREDDQYQKELEHEAKARIWRYREFGYYTIEEVVIMNILIPEIQEKIEKEKTFHYANLYTDKEVQVDLHTYYSHLSRLKKAFEIFHQHDIETRKCPRCGRFYEGLRPDFCEVCGYELPKEKMKFGCRGKIDYAEGKKYEINLADDLAIGKIKQYYSDYCRQKQFEGGYDNILPLEIREGIDTMYCNTIPPSTFDYTTMLFSL